MILREMIRFFLFILLTLFLLSGCASQVIGRHVQKGALVKEIGSGHFVERSRAGAIALVSPVRVQVNEHVERTEDTEQYFQKVVVRKLAKPRDYPYSDTYFKILLSTAVLPLFTYDFWVQGSYRGTKCSEEPDKCVIREDRSVVFLDYFTEKATRTTAERQKHDGSATVSLFINGYYKGELAISPDGIASVDLLKFPELGETEKDVKLTFKYRDSYVYSLLKNSEVKHLLQHGNGLDPSQAAISREN